MDVGHRRRKRGSGESHVRPRTWPRWRAPEERRRPAEEHAFSSETRTASSSVHVSAAAVSSVYPRGAPASLSSPRSSRARPSTYGSFVSGRHHASGGERHRDHERPPVRVSSCVALPARRRIPPRSKHRRERRDRTPARAPSRDARTASRSERPRPPLRYDSTDSRQTSSVLSERRAQHFARAKNLHLHLRERPPHRLRDVLVSEPVIEPQQQHGTPLLGERGERLGWTIVRRLAIEPSAASGLLARAIGDRVGAVRSATLRRRPLRPKPPSRPPLLESSRERGARSRRPTARGGVPGGSRLHPSEGANERLLRRVGRERGSRRADRAGTSGIRGASSPYIPSSAARSQPARSPIPAPASFSGRSPKNADATASVPG